MQLSTALRVLAVLSASASALAAPTDITLSETFTNLDAAPGTVERRARSVGVYLCNDRDFSGYCVHIVQPVNDCSMLSLHTCYLEQTSASININNADEGKTVRLGSDLNDKVSSVGPDKNAGSCRFFK